MRAKLFKRFTILLVVTAVVYFGGYFGVEYLRHRRGPWQVEFTTDDGMLAIRVNQPSVGVENVLIRLAGEPVESSVTNETATYVDPRDTPFPVPYGRVIFEDLTFLPGTLTFDLHGHGIELVSRTLNLNGKEHAWKSGEVITLQPDEKLHPITPAEYKARVKQLKN